MPGRLFLDMGVQYHKNGFTFSGALPSEESARRPKVHSKWNESDLDVSYERKPHHTYDSKSFSVPLPQLR